MAALNRMAPGAWYEDARRSFIIVSADATFVNYVELYPDAALPRISSRIQWDVDVERGALLWVGWRDEGMAKGRKHDVHEAHKRGLISEEEITSAGLARVEERICPACGEKFRPFDSGHRGFCCACCAFTWGEMIDQKKLDRMLGVGVEVVLLATGAIGVIKRVLNAQQAEIATNGDSETLTLADIERIQYLNVTHFEDCKKKGWTDEKRARIRARMAAKRTEQVVKESEEDSDGREPSWDD